MSDDSEDTKYPVKLYVYDLSGGMARSMSQQLLGFSIDAIYHTSIIFNNIEYFYGAGIQTAIPGTTHHGYPGEIVKLGESAIPPEIVDEFLIELQQEYQQENYDLFDHNCNHFTEEFAQFLIGDGIPTTITSLPATVLNTPFGQMIRPYIDQMIRPVVQNPQDTTASTSVTATSSSTTNPPSS